MKSLETFLSSHPAWQSLTSQSPQSPSSQLSHTFSNFVVTPATRPRVSTKLAFWKEIVWDAIYSGALNDQSVLWFDSKDIERAFTVGSLTPLCFDTLLTEWFTQGDLVSLSDYKKERNWTTWAFERLIYAPLNWGYHQMMDTHDLPQPVERISYVCVSLVQKAADKVLEIVSKEAIHLTDNVKTFKELSSIVSRFLNPTDLDLVLLHLKRAGLIHIRYSEKVKDKVIKFNITRKTRIQEIDEKDEGIAVMKSTLSHLQNQIHQMNLKLESLTLQAKTYLSKGQKELALHCIKHKKVVQGLLEKRLGGLNTLEMILLKINNSQTDADILAAYSVGADTLQSVITSSGLTHDSIHAIMDKLEDSLADQKEMEDVMRLGDTGIAQIQDEDVEDELEQLIAMEQEARANQVLESMPKVDDLPEMEPLSDALGALDIESQEKQKKKERLELEPLAI